MINPYRLPILAVAALLAVKAHAVPVVIGGSVGAYAHDHKATTASQSVSLAPGAAAGSGAAASGTAASEVAFSAATSGAATAYAFAFDQDIGLPTATAAYYYDWWSGYSLWYSGDIYAQSNGYVRFTLAADDVGYTYDVSGLFAQEGTSQMILGVSLYDATARQTLLDTYQYNNTPSTDRAMQPGGQGADVLNHLNGGLSGALQAGHTYTFNFHSLIRHYEVGPGTFTNPHGETATHGYGNMTLTLQGPELEAVPEPSSVALMGLGLLGLGFAARRRARKG